MTLMTPVRPFEIQPWDAARQALDCVGVIDEAPQVKTFLFRAGSRTWFHYRPGQFDTLELPTANGPLLRTYTLASSPSRPFAVAVTVKAQAESVGTRWMFENVAPGSRIRAHGPAGGFVLPDAPTGPYLFLAAGSGVTPMMSMLRWCADCAPAVEATLILCARRPE